MDDTTIRQPLDRKYVNINQPHEVKYWCKKFGCTKVELEAAVALVGNKADDVRKFFTE